MITVGAVEEFLHDLYPPGSAQGWDRVGLVTGDRAARAGHILLTVDVTDAVIEQARRLGAGMIVAHHPLLLRGIHAVDPDDPKGRMLTELIRNGIGLITAHTNADVPPGGVADALASALGVADRRPMVPTVHGLDKISTYVPQEHTEAVIAALGDVGAGAIGRYDRCAYQTPGTGRFRPLPGSDPYLGAADEVTRVTEDRVEMIADRGLRRQIRTALLAAHPYEEPAFDITEVAAPEGPSRTAPAPGQGSVSGLGRIGDIAPARLADFVDRVADTLPATAGGVRAAGDPDRTVTRIAIQGGAGDDLLDTARHLGADVFVTSDLRHHPATEALAWDDAPALIDVSHWAAEWTWLPMLRERLVAAFGDEPGLPVTVDRTRTDAWSWTVGAAQQPSTGR